MHCVICHTEPKKYYQVDYICDEVTLLSNYHEQILIKTPIITPTLNDTFCDQCINDVIMKHHQFEKEGDYTFIEGGYTCWDTNKYQQYKNYIGDCLCCSNKVILDSIYNKNKKNAYIVWTNNIISQVLPECLEPKVFIAKEQLLTGFLCNDCFNITSTIPCKGPIICQLCETNHQRWLFQSNTEPTKYGVGCECHYNEEEKCIFDGFIDPMPYQWINKPLHFDNNIPFCNVCLNNLCKSGDIKEDWDSEEQSI